MKISFKMPIFAMPLVMAADIKRQQLRLVRTENLDSSQYTRMTVLVVCPNMYTNIHPASVGWVSLFS